jgi:chemotaxis-related protein WspD
MTEHRERAPAAQGLDMDMQIDDCWKRIGTRGDHSCPALAEWTRCLNCPVYERAAARLLDRPLADAEGGVDAVTLDAAPEARPVDAPAGAAEAGRDAGNEIGSFSADSHSRARVADADQSSETCSAVVFRVADEWLALPTDALKQIEDQRPVHSLPHRRNRVVLGLVNVRGALTVAVSLRELLRLDRSSATPGAAGAAAGAHAARSGRYARMLVAAHHGEPVVFPVDEVHGVVRYAAGALKPVPDTLTRSSAAHAAGVLAWQGKTVGVLDAARVFASLTQSLQ